MVGLVSQHTFEVNMLGMEGINFMYVYLYLKCLWKTTFEEKVVCAVIEKHPDFITLTPDEITFLHNTVNKNLI